MNTKIEKFLKVIPLLALSVVAMLGGFFTFTLKADALAAPAAINQDAVPQNILVKTSPAYVEKLRKIWRMRMAKIRTLQQREALVRARAVQNGARNNVQ